MKTNTKFNIRILLIFAGFAIITLAFGLFLADEIDILKCWWKTAIGIIAYIVLIVGCVRFGQYVNEMRYFALQAEEKVKKQAAKTKK